jgi:hypothetical protein
MAGDPAHHQPKDRRRPRSDYPIGITRGGRLFRQLQTCSRGALSGIGPIAASCIAKEDLGLRLGACTAKYVETPLM